MKCVTYRVPAPCNRIAGKWTPHIFVISSEMKRRSGSGSGTLYGCISRIFSTV